MLTDVVSVPQATCVTVSPVGVLSVNVVRFVLEYLPATNNLPSVVIARVVICVPLAQYILSMFSDDKRWVSVVTLVVSPLPCCPLPLLPQPKSSPFSVNTHVTLLPHATCFICMTSYCAVNVIFPVTFPLPLVVGVNPVK